MVMPCKVMKNVYVQKCRMLNTFKCVLEKKKKTEYQDEEDTYPGGLGRGKVLNLSGCWVSADFKGTPDGK